MSPSFLALLERNLPRYTSYPTAPHFHAGVTGDTYRRWLSALPTDERISLYLHVPFCAQMCWYCGCNTTVANQYRPIAEYAQQLAQEIETAVALLPGRLTVGHIHWGGGTPSMLSDADLAHLMDVIRAGFTLADDAEIAIEIDPRTLKPGQAAHFAACGINRASLGVQDFDPTVQQAINRVQSYEQTARAVDDLRSAGIGGLNLDLMYGLPYQDLLVMETTIHQALTLDPDRIALFGYAHVPWMKRHQALIPDTHLPNTRERLAQSTRATEIIEAAGYHSIGLDHFARAHDPLVVKSKTGTLRRNFQGYTTDEADILLGFGASAISTLPQGYVQNEPTIAPWRAKILAGDPPVARGIAVDDRDRRRRRIIERLMCDLALDLSDEIDDGVDASGSFTDAFARIDELAREGIVERHGPVIRITKKGRPLVRAVCAAFDDYLRQDIKARHSIAV